MDTGWRAAVGASVAVAALAVTGVVVPAGGGGSPANAAALTPFADCDALLRWYVDRSIDQVGPYGWGARPWTLRTMTADAAAEPGPVTASGTGTNTQEPGIDEPDVAKTDGRLVVRLLEGRRVVLTDVTGARPRDVGRWQLPRDEYADGLLLVGDHVLVTGSRPFLAADRIGPGGGRETTRLVDLDVSDPARPVVAATTTWSGRTLALRQYGDTVRLVTATGLPDLPFVAPRPGRLTEARATERNRAVVRDSRIGDWLPTGVSCADVLHPADATEARLDPSADTLTVATLRPGEDGPVDTVALTGAGEEVYSSADRLYVFSTAWGPVGPLGGRVRPVPATTTRLHAFDLDPGQTTYVASGSVSGQLRDRWSLDEHDGHLRAAVSWPARAGRPAQSGIVVLEERAGRLVRTGELRGLGVDEDVQSVRWLGDLAVVVTFRRVDPLHTVDLTDPERPRLLGALKIPGFSSYLHPLGDHLLLGIGTDATVDGRSRGAQAAVFDLSDATRVRRVSTVAFGELTTLAAAEDPHAFTWLPGARTAVTPLWRQGGGVGEGAGLVRLHVSGAGDLTAQELPGPGGWEPRALPLDGDRVALVGERVQVVRVAG